jgi:hypothetical protein
VNPGSLMKSAIVLATKIEEISVEYDKILTKIALSGEGKTKYRIC